LAAEVRSLPEILLPMSPRGIPRPDTGIASRTIGFSAVFRSLADPWTLGRDRHGLACEGVATRVWSAVGQIIAMPHHTTKTLPRRNPAMRLDPATCPVCRRPSKGTLEIIPGLALLLFGEDGLAEYSGQTEIDWNGQKTVEDDPGRVVLRCPVGHEWSAKMTS
jgi:hypothetical protein